MSDTSPDELSSLYKSIKKGSAFPIVIRTGKKTFQSLLEKTGGDPTITTMTTRTSSNRYVLDSSSELTRLNDLLSNSKTILKSHGKSVSRALSRRRRRSGRSNVFANILKDGADASKSAGWSDSSRTLPLDSNGSDEILNPGLATREPFLRPRVKVKAFSRSQVQGFANAFGFDDDEEGRRGRHGTLRANSSDSSGSAESPAPNFTSKVGRRDALSRRKVLENILNPAGQPRRAANEATDSKLSSESSTARNRFHENKLQKSSLIYDHNVVVPAKNDDCEVFGDDVGSSGSAKRTRRDQPDKYEKVSRQDTGSGKQQQQRRHVDKENYFGKIRKSMARDSNSYGNNNNYEVIAGSNALGSKDTPPVAERSGENYKNLKFNIRGLSAEDRDEKPDHINKLPGMRNLYQINEMPAAEDKRDAGDYSLLPTANQESRQLHPPRKVFDDKYSSSDLTFDSDVVLHSTLRNTPVLKRMKGGTVLRDKEHDLMYEGRRSGNPEEKRRLRPSSRGKHSRVVEAVAGSGSPYEAKRSRSERKQVSEPYSGSDEVGGRNHSQRTGESEVGRQTGNESTGGKRKLQSRQTAGEGLSPKIRLRSRSDASDVLDDGEGVSSDASKRIGQPMEAPNRDENNYGIPYNDSEPDSPVFNFDKRKRKSDPKEKNESLPTDKLIRSRGSKTTLDVNRPSVSSPVSKNSERLLPEVSEGKQRTTKGMSKHDKINLTTLKGDEGTAYGDGEPESAPRNFDKGKRDSEPKNSNESLATDKPKMKPRTRSQSSVVLENSEGVSPNASKGKRKPMDKSNRDIPNSRRHDGIPEDDDDSQPVSPVLNFDKGKRNSEVKKSTQRSPTDALIRSPGNEAILGVNRPSVSSPVANNSGRLLPDVSEGKRRTTKGMSKLDKINGPTLRSDEGTAYSQLESPPLNFDKGKRNSEPKRSNESLPTDKLIGSRGNEAIPNVNRPSVSPPDRSLSDVSEGKRRTKRDKVNAPAISDKQLESLIFKYDKFERSSKLKKSNENFPANKLARSGGDEPILSQDRPSVSSRVLDNPEKVLSDVSGSKGSPGETSKPGESSRRNVGNSDSDPESPLFNFVKLKRRSEVEKVIGKLSRSRGGENRPLVSSRVLNNSERVLTDVSRSRQRPEETSKRDVGNTYSDPESPLFHLVKPKPSSQVEKANEKLPAHKLSRSRGDGIIKGGRADLPLETGSTSRKFAVGGKVVTFKKPAEWLNNRFYNKLIPFFETKFGPLRCFSACEDAAVELHNNVKRALSKPGQRVACVNKVRKILYDVGVIKTPMDFMVYAQQYLPNEFIVIAVPIRIGSRVTGVPYPEDVGLFDDLKLS